MMSVSSIAAGTTSGLEQPGRVRILTLFFFPPPSFPASPYFPFLSPLLLLERPPPRAGAKMWRDMELRKESGAERLRAWLSRRAAPSQWLGEEVKAPATLASQRPRLFGAVAVSVAGMRVAFSPFCRPHLCNNKKTPTRLRRARLVVWLRAQTRTRGGWPLPPI